MTPSVPAGLVPSSMRVSMHVGDGVTNSLTRIMAATEGMYVPSVSLHGSKFNIAHSRSSMWFHPYLSPSHLKHSNACLDITTETSYVDSSWIHNSKAAHQFSTDIVRTILLQCPLGCITLQILPYHACIPSDYDFSHFPSFTSFEDWHPIQTLCYSWYFFSFCTFIGINCYEGSHWSMEMSTVSSGSSTGDPNVMSSVYLTGNLQ